jgi:hypothetical protein
MLYLAVIDIFYKSCNYVYSLLFTVKEDAMKFIDTEIFQQ